MTTAYRVPRAAAPVDLYLDGNEGRLPDALAASLGPLDPEVVRRYPDTGALERELAGRLRVAAERLLVTAGADDAIDRTFRAFLGPGREIVYPKPTFEMVPRYAALAGARPVEIPWRDGPFPREAFERAIGPATSVVVVVTPNNPTGATAARDDLQALSRAARGAVLLIDLAYVEFADDDPTPYALALDNAIVVRTLSKAWGLAGLRVGYACGRAEWIEKLRASGGPYAVAGPSLALARTCLERTAGCPPPFVSAVRGEREALAAELRALGAGPVPSSANFVLARFGDPAWVQEALAGLGIAVRRFPGRPELEGDLRITCPGERSRFERLRHALRTVMAPEALLLDLDGVLADVSRSYRMAVLETARAFGVELDPDEVRRAKEAGSANNDWILTRRLLAERGHDVAQQEVTARFEAIYQGTEDAPGLRQHETLLPDRPLLERLSGRLPLALVTGRPRSDALAFLDRFGIRDRFRELVTMEDAPGKPDPAPVRVALERLGVERAWMVGDTPDDVTAARAAAVLPVGILAPGDDESDMERAMGSAGAARVLRSLEELEDLLP